MTFEEFHAAEGERLYALVRKHQLLYPDDEEHHKYVFGLALKETFYVGRENQLDLTQVKVGGL